jgi:hypothetical protein
MQTTSAPAAKKHWTAPTVTAVRSASTAEAGSGKLINLGEILSIGIGGITIALGPAS